MNGERRVGVWGKEMRIGARAKEGSAESHSIRRPDQSFPVVKENREMR